ncbi:MULTISPECIES: ParB N-terminal domain-containing protein [unclassified Mycobacterium]|uniref:ParB/RepB/Spo0J family partition protein n=1 Tax=unclassified Mycobacterium TaxID=2642494 RepID=UPI0007FDACEE|nr:MULTISPECIES: ParB N-terminal domain-containing protein [unclassified Mycobacterium]OBG71000.1 nuclease [Mycobacterium sp. E1214]OBH28973.1 nuclease [Mycobacterium sp. E1319]
MIDTTTTDSAAPVIDQLIGTLEHLDPMLLDIGDNVRDDAALSKAFIANIAENGVLVPITGVRDPERPEVVRVRNGQRRTLAAREVGLSSVPVYVLPRTAVDASQETIDRIVHQIVTNDQKRDLTDAQRARGIQQMIDAGMSVTKVAKRLSVPKDAVKAAHAAAGSATAMDALASGQLSLAEAAAITEFEDMPGAVDRLMRSAGGTWFEHTVAQLRQERAADEARAHAAQPFADKGFTILEDRPDSWDPACIPLHHLVTADGDEADDTAVTTPAHWAVYLVEDTARCDVDTGEVVDEETVDWDTEDQPDATPAEGLRHANTVTEKDVFTPDYYCLDYRATGLRPQSWFARQAGLVDTDTGEAVDLDDDARQQAAAERAEADKRERRKVLALNKLGDAALSVRREFVKKLLTRKIPPKGAALFVAECLARDGALLTTHNALDTTAELLGVDNGQAVAKLVADLPANGDGRAQVLTLALVLGALESRTPKDAWRNNTGWWGHHVGSGEYLRWLSDNDYPLAPVERVVTKTESADEVYEQYLADAVKE